MSGVLSAHPQLRLEGVGTMEFWVFGEVKIFLISEAGGYPMRGGVCFAGEVNSFSVHFLILKCKISEIQIFLSAAPSLSLLKFSDLRHAGVQIHIDFNTESKSLLFFKDQFLFTPQWSFKTNETHETAFFCIHLVDLQGPSNHPVSKARAFCVI